MRALLLCVLACGGCFDFSRVERVGDLGASDGAVDLGQPDATLDASSDGGDGGLVVSCPSIVMGPYGSPVTSTSGEYVAVVGEADQQYAAYAATASGEVLRLMKATASPLVNVSTLGGGGYSTIARITEDPSSSISGSIVVAANSATSLLPAFMPPSGMLTATSPSPGTSTDIAATTGYLIVAVGSKQPYTLATYDRSDNVVRSTTVDSAYPPRVLANDGVVVVCGSEGLSLFDPMTGLLTPVTGPDDLHLACTSLAAATLSTGTTRWAYTSTDGFVCVADGLSNPWSCTQPQNSIPIAVAIAPCDPDFLIAVTMHDVFMSTNDGATWAEQSTNLPVTTLLGVTITTRGTAYFIAQGGKHFTWH